MKFSTRKLKNGLTVVEVPSNDAASVVVDFFVKTGSRSETEKEGGISHFLEHFLFKGTKKYPSAMAITELVDGFGGEMNANTGKEHTQYYIKAASDKLETIFEVLTDMIQNPLMSAEEMEREKGVIIEELRMYKDMPTVDVEYLLEKTMWPDQPLGRDIVGTVETIKALNVEMFQSYMKRHYQAPNMILGVSGKYNKKKLDALIEKYWAAMPRRAFGKWAKVKESQKNYRLNVSYKATEQSHFVLGFTGYKYGDKKNPAALLLSTILGSGMSSRLFYEVRERRGLGYYVRAGHGSYQDTGVFQINAGVQVDKIEEALNLILTQLKKISTELVSETEMNKAKEYLKGRTTLALEDNQARLDWCLEQEAFHGHIQTPEELFGKIDAVTPKQVIAVAKDLFQSAKMNLAIIGPYKTDKNFKKLLEKF